MASPLSLDHEVPGLNSTLCSDVISCIIDCFDDEKPFRNRKMLATCSLVCRSWRQHSQMKLLQTIILRNKDRFHMFISALPTLSERIRLFIRELIVADSKASTSSAPLHFSQTQLILLLDTLPNLVSLSLCHVLLDTDGDQPRAAPSGRSLQYLYLENVTNSVLSWHPIREIVTFASVFKSIDNISVMVNPSFIKERTPLDRRTVEAIRADTSWMVELPTSLPVKSLTIRGPPTTHLHILRLIHLTNPMPTLNTLRVSVLDPDIIAEIEGIIGDNPSCIETMDLSFSPDLYRLMDGESTQNALFSALLTYMFTEELAGFKRESMFPGSLAWTIDASLLTNLRVLHLEYRLQFIPESIQEFGLHRWIQLLRCLDHFSTAPVQFINLDLRVDFWAPDDPCTLRMLEQLAWTKASALLQHFGSLRQFHVKLHCYSTKPFDEQRSVVITYLELISKGLSSLKSEGKVRIDWIYYIGSDDNLRWEPGVFTLP